MKSNKLSQCWLLSSIKRVVSQKRRTVSMEAFLKRREKPKEERVVCGSVSRLRLRHCDHGGVEREWVVEKCHNLVHVK